MNQPKIYHLIHLQVPKVNPQVKRSDFPANRFLIYRRVGVLLIPGVSSDDLIGSPDSIDRQNATALPFLNTAFLLVGNCQRSFAHHTNEIGPTQ